MQEDPFLKNIKNKLNVLLDIGTSLPQESNTFHRHKGHIAVGLLLAYACGSTCVFMVMGAGEWTTKRATEVTLF